jgi:hypothetical protein
MLTNHQAFVPLTGPALSVLAPANPVTVATQPPLANPAAAALLPVIGQPLLELWETQ